MLKTMCKNLRKTMRKSMWEKGEKVSTFLKYFKSNVIASWKILDLHKFLNINYHSFSTKNSINFSLLFYSFSHFPHSLLLLLLNKFIII